MSWFFFALICLLGWGFADLFYKRGTDEKDRYSHLKIAVWVGPCCPWRRAGFPRRSW